MWLRVVGCVFATLGSGAAQAQHITVDGSLSPGQTLVGPNYNIGANLGKQVGGNLFHSFGLFGLSSGESANFTGPSNVANIIGRITGGVQSSINGKVQSSIAGANLYLVNPAGFVFGPNATINVSGSFHAATADYLKLADGAKFQATNPGGSTLTAAAPAAFGFLNAAPPSITVNGSQLIGATGSTLSLVGGPVSITGGAAIAAPAGTIHVTGVASTGEVPVDPTNTAGYTVTSHAPVRLIGNSVLDVDDPVTLGTGSIYVHSGTLTIDASGAFADNDGASPGGQLSLTADTQIAISNGSRVQSLAFGTGKSASISLSTSPTGAISIDNNSLVQTGSQGAGKAGDLAAATGALSLGGNSELVSEVFGTGDSGAIAVSANSLSITGGAVIATLTLGAGNAGNVVTDIAGAVTIDGTGTSANSVTQIGSQTATGSTGSAGSILVTAGSVTLLGGGSIGGATGGSGNAGNVTLNIAGALTIDEAAAPNGFTGISSESNPGTSGNPGSISVTAASIALTDGGIISTTTFGSGNAGPITITTPGALTIDGASLSHALTGIASQANPGATGNASNITVNAGSLSLINEGVISTSTFGPGAGGNIGITLANSFLIDGSQAVGSATGVISVTLGKGNAGNITLSAASGSILPVGQIITSTAAAGPAGNIAIDVTGALTIAGTGAVDFSTGIQSNAVRGSTGNAGQITLKAGSLSLTQIATVATNTFGPGNAGSIVATIGGDLVVDGGIGIITSGLLSQAEPGSTGNAGTVTITAATISLTNLGQIASSTFGAGNGGNVTVTASGNITIDGAVNGLNSGIFSDADVGSSGNGGRVNVTAGSITITKGGGITSTTIASGNGGDVVVTTSGLLSMDGVSDDGSSSSGIASQTFPGSTGNAGEVTITAGAMSITNAAAISTATFGRGNGGNIVANVAGQLTIDGGNALSPTGIASDTAPGRTGDAGRVSVTAGSMTLTDGAVITTSTAGPGAAGGVTVNVAGQLSVGTDSVIFSNANVRSTGNAGSVAITAGGLSLTDVGQISSTTFSSGEGGDVTVAVAGLLTEDGHQGNIPSGIFAHADPGSTGDAGKVTVTAGTIALTGGSEISTSTFGPGKGGDVVVAVAGALSVSGRDTVINSDANPGSTGNAGTVFITAGSLSVDNEGQIATSTNGPGSGGNVNVAVKSGIVLSGGERAEITAQSNSTGNAGSIQVAAESLQLFDGASISTQAATANGGNIVLQVSGLFYLLDSRVTTSVDGAKGNGGNITIDPAFVVLNNSQIIAQAVGGNGGNINITAGEFLESADSLVSASSQLGISGSIDIQGPQVELDKSLVTLQTELRDAPVVFRDSCSGRNGLPRSTLVDAGRGGLPQDTDATIPALYLAGRGFDSALPPVPARGGRGASLALPPIFETASATLLSPGCR